MNTIGKNIAKSMELKNMNVLIRFVYYLSVNGFVDDLNIQ
jgi:hypothetical protein